MPKGGHNRKPRALKVIHGTFRTDRNPGREPMPSPVASVPEAPVGLNRWARAEWTRIAPQLHAQGLLTVVDLAALEIACKSYGMFREAEEAIFTVPGRGGKARARSLRQYLRGRNSQTTPALAAYRDGRNAYRAFMAEFGLSPASRNRIEVPKKEKPRTRMQELLQGDA